MKILLPCHSWASSCQSLVGYYFWCFLLLIHQETLGQHDAGVFYQLTTKNGLSSNRTTTVIQDRKGYYWIGTEDGLNRFDGTSCKVFRTIKGDSNSLSNNYCMFLLEDDRGNIWVGTQEGVSIYDTREGRFRRIYFHLPAIPGERVNSIKGLAKDDQGNIYVCSYGIWQFNTSTGKWRSFTHESNTPGSLPAGYFFTPLYDSLNKGLWMKSSAGYVFFDRSSGKFYSRMYNPKMLVLLNEHCDDSRMVQDRFDRIWVYSPDSLLLESYSIGENKIQMSACRAVGAISQLSVDNENRIWVHYWNRSTAIYSPDKKTTDSNFLKYYHSKSALSRMAVSVFTDINGCYWICSKKGISIFSAQKQTVSYYTINPDHQPAEDSHLFITCLAEQDEKLLWIGTNFGLYQFKLPALELTKFINPFRSDFFIRSMYLQGDSILWIGGQSALARYNIKKNKMVQYIPFSSPVQCIYALHEGQIWIGTWSNGLYEYSVSGQLLRHITKERDPRKGLVSDYLLCVSGAQKESCLWVGYNGGSGYSKVSANQETFEHFNIDAGNDSKISNSVNCITEDKTGRLWMGTYGSGLICYDSHNHRYSGYSQNEGLSGAYVNAVFADDSDRIWISTSNGLDILDTRSQTLVNTELDLEQSSNDLIANCTVRKNKNLLFFARNRLVEITPATYMLTQYPSVILLNSFKIFDKEMFLPDSEGKQLINLSYRQNFFSFEYSLLKPDPDRKVLYAYKLDGFDSGWNYVRYRHFANYTNVPPGGYVFRIKAADMSGKWLYFSRPVEVVISPPFWKEWWFIASLAGMASCLIYILFRYRIRQIRRMYLLRSGISKDLHDQIGATLTSISFLSEVAKKQTPTTDAAVKTLDKIGDYSRDMIAEMNDIVWAINPMNDSFEKIIDRMQNFAVPFLASKEIQFCFTCDERLRSVALNMQQRKNLYLIFKESVNNAAKYSGCREVMVSLQKANSYLQLEIKDNGIGFLLSGKNQGNGLRNMRQRAGEVNGRLEIHSKPGSGTGILLVIPITQNAD